MFRKYSFVFIVLSLQICLSYSAVVKTKRVCVVGAGIAGISAARYLKEEGIDFTVYESTQYVGGTWRFDPRVGTDENGLPLHTSMYKNLRTNLPKPTMELRGFPLPEHLPSFPSWRDYYQYLQDYSKHFNILDNIKVSTIIHSHDYKEPEPFRNRRVLIVGAGPSGVDIGLDVAEVAKTLVHSHHSKINFSTPFPPHYHKKPDIQEFNETGVIFKDGSYEEIDDVIYCTDESSGLTLSPKSIVPLYRYMVNINQPSMILMGLIVRACLVVALDAQDQYYAELSEESGIERVPPVMFKIRTQDIQAKLENFYTFRNYVYTVIDDQNFVRHDEDPAVRRGLTV
ncbi:hypothetical protein HF086_003440 [Spodoptera exigua]|uniref:Flavin-containing monooxygenase n=1 Tax=Spodoptera exigua TaxID=7107 RepID=A0A922MIC8_SPOEX|nr:hypothetical protein HF086_003440 [Spodoptera exigua]